MFIAHDRQKDFSQELANLQMLKLRRHQALAFRTVAECRYQLVSRTQT